MFGLGLIDVSFVLNVIQAEYNFRSKYSDELDLSTSSRLSVESKRHFMFFAQKRIEYLHRCLEPIRADSDMAVNIYVFSEYDPYIIPFIPFFNVSIPRTYVGVRIEISDVSISDAVNELEYIYASIVKGARGWMIYQNPKN